MLFDFTMSTLHRKNVLLPEADRVRREVDFAYIEADFWGEHCIECGVPYCYQSCQRFSPTLAGWCRRFKDGIVRVSLAGGGEAISIQLLPWGKIGMPVYGKMFHRRWLKLFAFIDRIGCAVAIYLMRFFEARYGTPNPISYYKAFRSKVLLPLVSKQIHASRWIIEGICEKEISVRCSISSGDRREVFVQNVRFKRGFNAFEFDISNQPHGYYLISSVEGLSVPIYFTRLAIVADGKIVQSDKTSSCKVAKYVKCVIWDLDNTLWDGILSEDGPEGVRVRQDVLSVIKELDQRGIVNSICSKNDYDVTWKKLESLHVAEYFVYPKINWMPKSENIKHTAQDMNIGWDALAFVDDSANERNEVLANVSGIRVFKDTSASELLKMECFNPPVSSESSRRRLSYQEEMKRKQSASKFNGSFEAFLKDCQIQLSIEAIREDAVSRRCYELVNRTNQLTLAARRYTEAEFFSLLRTEGVAAYSIRCKDKYGDYGIIGFVAISSKSMESELVEFVMSCRVAAKKCEQSVVAAVAAKLAQEGRKKLSVKVVRTERNKALLDAFSVIPFDRQDFDEKHIVFTMPLTTLPVLLKGLFLNETTFQG